MSKPRKKVKKISEIKRIIDQFQKASDKAAGVCFDIENLMAFGEWDIWLGVNSGKGMVEIAGPECEVVSSETLEELTEKWCDGQTVEDCEELAGSLERCAARVREHASL